MADPKPAADYNRVYFLVNMERCGYCRKFAPVMETNLAAMNSRARELCTIADINTPEGRAVFDRLGYRGGVPCTAAVRPSGEVVAMEAGYRDNKKLGPLLARLMMA